MIIDQEIWRTVVGFDGQYEVSNVGQVRSSQKGYSGHILTQYENHRGYLKVGLTLNGKRMYRFVHRIVADAFLAPDASLPFVDHRDMDKKNNREGNLRRCTQEQNFRWAVEGGAVASGVHHRRAKLTAAQVEEVRAAKAAGGRFWGATALAQKFGVCVQTINGVAREFTYKSVVPA